MTRRTASLTVLSALSGSRLQAAPLPRPASDFVVRLPGGKTAKVSDYQGKVLVLGFILTTCSHCQLTAQILNILYQESGSKGLAILLGAINPGANVPEFIRSFNLPYPVGDCDNSQARLFMGFPEMQMAYMPWLSFIDRSGQIRYQFQGADKHVLSDDSGIQEKNLRKYIDGLLGEKPAPRTAPSAKKSVPKK